MQHAKLNALYTDKIASYDELHCFVCHIACICIIMMYSTIHVKYSVMVLSVILLSCLNLVETTIPAIPVIPQSSYFMMKEKADGGCLTRHSDTSPYLTYATCKQTNAFYWTLGESYNNYSQIKSKKWNVCIEGYANGGFLDDLVTVDSCSLSQNYLWAATDVSGDYFKLRNYQFNDLCLAYIPFRYYDCGYQSSQLTIIPTPAPTSYPTTTPTVAPTNQTLSPTVAPSSSPTSPPTISPTYLTTSPTSAPSSPPTSPPTISPTPQTLSPTSAPSRPPTSAPSLSPTSQTSSPTDAPTELPTTPPSIAPTHNTLSPTNAPTQPPTSSPTFVPTYQTFNPTVAPTISPTMSPSIAPTPLCLTLYVNLIN
eukprot:530558_1